jgi:hypothetical protein
MWRELAREYGGSVNRSNIRMHNARPPDTPDPVELLEVTTVAKRWFRQFDAG